jgi:hypothetical protein
VEIRDHGRYGLIVGVIVLLVERLPRMGGTYESTGQHSQGVRRTEVEGSLDKHARTFTYARRHNHMRIPV